MRIDLSAPVKRFVEDMGLVAEAEGLPRIAGMIMGLMLAVDQAYSLEDLQTTLQVSHGSVSTNVRLLESLGVTERTSHLGDRKTYFQLTEDPYGRLLAGSMDRMRHVKRIVETGLAEFPTKGPERGDRLEDMAGFYDLAISITASAIDTWSKRSEDQE